MIRKLTVLLATAALSFALVLPASAATTWYYQKTVGSSQTATINPAGLFTCAIGKRVVIKTYTYDFLWFDSTGTMRMQLRDGAGNISSLWWRTTEWDVVTKYWYTSKIQVDWVNARLSDVSSAGVLQLSLGCYDI